jgi:hypothetical protein
VTAGGADAGIGTCASHHANSFAVPDEGNWTPWFFSLWQPGLGEPLGVGTTINAAVETGELCVPDIYWQWGARGV